MIGVNDDDETWSLFILLSVYTCLVTASDLCSCSSHYISHAYKLEVSAENCRSVILVCVEKKYLRVRVTSWDQRGLGNWVIRVPSSPLLSFFTPLFHSPYLFFLSAALRSLLPRLMDHHNLIRNIFSRNTSPPIQSYPDDQSPSTQHFPQFQHVSPSQSLKDVAPSSPPTHVESLFSNLTATGQSSVNPNPPLQGTAYPMTTTTAAAATASGPTSPASSITALSAPTNMSTSTNTPPNANPQSDSRQSALLSLLSSVSPAGSSSSSAPQQIPTPPAPSGPPNRTVPITAANNESQGRLLLEQLMSG
jgi:hypothetical protein